MSATHVHKKMMRLQGDSGGLAVGRDFLLCDYNRDGDSYRSPWSDKYFPAIPDGLQISELLR